MKRISEMEEKLKRQGSLKVEEVEELFKLKEKLKKMEENYKKRNKKSQLSKGQSHSNTERRYGNGYNYNGRWDHP